MVEQLHERYAGVLGVITCVVTSKGMSEMQVPAAQNSRIRTCVLLLDWLGWNRNVLSGRGTDGFGDSCRSISVTCAPYATQATVVVADTV